MSIEVLNVPQDAVVSVRFYHRVSGVLTDPTALTVRYRNPSGSVVTLVYGVDAALVKDSTGLFRVDITASVPGMWEWDSVSTGTAAGASEGRFFCKDVRTH